MSWSDRRIEKKTKIRKRARSSSSSSSLVRKYRFKRAILVAERGKSSTAVPSWKMSTRSPSDSRASSSLEFAKCQGKDVSVSARKLAATLWDINEVPLQKVKSSYVVDHDLKGVKKKERIGKISQSEFSDPNPNVVSERINISEVGRQQGSRGSTRTQKFQLTDNCLADLDSLSTSTLMEIESNCHRKCTVGVKNCLKEVKTGLTTSKELLEVLNRISDHEDHQSSTLSLITALRLELDRARFQVDQLIKEQSSDHNEINHLMKRFAEEKAAWRSKEEEKFQKRISCASDQLEVEKKLRRQAERLNKKIGKELAETKVSLSKTLNELERERRTKEIFEQVCDELARGIGEDRAQVEELRKESEKVREEVEKEREMLQLADILREERVQMKLLEAKYHFEEKNAAVERLKDEFEAYLKTQVGNKEHSEESPKFEKIKELEDYLKKINFGSSHIMEKTDNEGEVLETENKEEDESADSDLHSIELNMDNNNKSFKWSSACGINGTHQDDSKRNSVERDFRGRKSISEKIQWGSICFNRVSSIGKHSQNSDGFDWEKLSELLSKAQTRENEGGLQRCRSVKRVKDHILAVPKVASIENLSSPTMQRRDQFLTSQHSGNETRESSTMLQRG